jgi:hypothetical protein
VWSAGSHRTGFGKDTRNPKRKRETQHDTKGRGESSEEEEEEPRSLAAHEKNFSIFISSLSLFFPVLHQTWADCVCVYMFLSVL